MNYQSCFILLQPKERTFVDSWLYKVCYVHINSRMELCFAWELLVFNSVMSLFFIPFSLAGILALLEEGESDLKVCYCNQ